MKTFLINQWFTFGKTKILNVRPQNSCVFGANWANWEIENLYVKGEKSFLVRDLYVKIWKSKSFGD